jgi:hypothetical protein
MLQDDSSLKGAGKPNRLTYDEWGRSNNTCVRIDNGEFLFGEKPGEWVERAATAWQDEQGRAHEGCRSTWAVDEKKVKVTQFVEVVPGEQSRLLDTCLVRYVLENEDRKPHSVGLRFLLDTWIGRNDGVPFTIPGQPGLCDTQAEFNSPVEVPDFIQALEFEDLQKPGTVVHVKLKLPGREPPGRVTLGAWPDPDLRLRGHHRARGQETGWDVPVLSMKTLYPYDSAVVIYWPEQPLPPGGHREVGFAFGLGSVSAGGKLLLTLDGSFKPGGTFTVTALVGDPQPGETLTLTAPDGFRVEAEATQPVPEAAGAGRNRPVTWKVTAGAAGEHTLTVRSSTGATQTQKVRIRTSSIFD